MNYAVGDTVVHWTHGIGKVIAIDQIKLAETAREYYVVEVGVLKLWVPVDEENIGSIRPPTASSQFKGLFEILRTAGNRLPDNQFKRKLELRDRMQKRTLEGLCHLIRDLTDRSRQHPLNQNDSSILFRAEEHLLDEWSLSLGVDRANALLEMEELLKTS
jgi:RNA polymerase-interacting CarD/CdnL/TRCF family regulator